MNNPVSNTARWLTMSILALLFLSPAWAQQRIPKPRLVVLVAIDQFRYDYLTRFRKEYTGGLDRLLAKGAVFVNANLDHYPTVTAIGHSTMLTGALPSTSGIVGNDWYDRDEKKMVTSVSDDQTQQLGGGGGRGASPRRLLVSTVGDELKRSGRESSKVIGISLKDRSAILPSGHMADAAYWYDTKSGDFVSSSYYFPELPAWAKSFNERRPVDQFAGAQWVFGGGLMKLPMEKGPGLSVKVYSTPFGNELVESFAEVAIREERLGQRGATDLLTLSFSSNDAIGHALGPDSQEVRDVTIRTDKLLAKLFEYLQRVVGMDRVLVALTADHGVAPLPERLAQDRMPGGRISGNTLFESMQNALQQRYGDGKWVLDTAGTSPYFNLDMIRQKKISESEFEETAARALARAPHVSRVFTRSQLLRGEAPPEPFSQRVAKSFNARRSGDLEVLLEPYWIRSASGATHGTPYTYDAHIPLVLMGPGINAGRYADHVVLNDLAPTLATLLDVETPSGSVGRVLNEAMSTKTVPAAR